MPGSSPCPKCKSPGLTLSDTIGDGWAVLELKCINCGYRPPPLSQAITFKEADRLGSFKSSQRMTTKTVSGLKKRSLQKLSPPHVPSNKSETDENVYESQCSTYAGYQHFQRQSILFRKKADSTRTKKAKHRNDYRARLCENLAYYLRSIYRSQTPDRLRAQLREQQKNRKGHPIKETNRTMNTSLKRYTDLMLIAMVHLPGDPIVQDWAGSRRACGDKRYLRRARKGIEKGVKTPYRTSAQALGDLTTIELGMEGKSPAEIREELLAKKLPPRSKEGIRKRLKVILALDK